MLFGSVGASSNGAPFCSVGDSSSDGTKSCLVLVALYQRSHSLVWYWLCFTIWHTVFSGGGDTLSDVAHSFLVVVVVALNWMAKTCVLLVTLHHMAHILFWWWWWLWWRRRRRWRWWLFIRWRKGLFGGGGDLSDATHFFSGAGYTTKCYGDVAACCARYIEPSHCFFSELLKEMTFICREISSYRPAISICRSDSAVCS